jgi:hypothetical protein
MLDPKKMFRKFLFFFLECGLKLFQLPDLLLKDLPIHFELWNTMGVSVSKVSLDP